MHKINFRIWTLCLCLLGGWASTTHAQGGTTMTVVHIAGKVSLGTAHQPIQLGQKISETDVLAFGGKHGKLIAWKSKGDLVVLHPSENASDHGGGLQGPAAGFVDANPLKPHAARIQHFSSTKQLKDHFEARKYLVLGKTWLIADQPFQPQGDTVLLLKYRNLSENYQTSHPIKFTADSLRIDRASLLDLNGKALDPEKLSDYRLWWYSLSTKKFGEITYLQFIFADEDVVASEVKQLLNLLSDKSVAEKRDAVRKFIEMGFGEPDTHNFEQWVAMHFPELK